MLGSRRGRPSLIGRAAKTAGRTAIIAGTATAVSGKVAAKQMAAAQAKAGAAERPEPAAASAGLSDEAIVRLRQLAELHQAGILTEEEFAEQKSRLLA